MNKYLLLGVAVLIVIAGWVFLGNKASTNKTKTSPAPTISASPTASSLQTMVNLTKTGFDPITLKVKVGNKVTWTNKSGAMATVNSDAHPTHTLWPFLNLGNFDDGMSVSVTFDKTGTYTYHNHLNPSQTGTVVVE